MAKKDNSKQIEAMRKAGFTDEEIQEMLADDDLIDHTKIGESGLDWELSPAEHKKAIKNANSDEKKQKGNTTRTRKENPEKRTLIVLVAEALSDYGAVITNPEKVIEFSIGEQKYSFSLTAHRKPKN